MNRRKFIALLAGVAALPAGFIAALASKPEPQGITSAQLDYSYDQIFRNLQKATEQVWTERYRAAFMQLTLPY